MWARASYQDGRNQKLAAKIQAMSCRKQILKSQVASSFSRIKVSPTAQGQGLTDWSPNVSRHRLAKRAPYGTGLAMAEGNPGARNRAPASIGLSEHLHRWAAASPSERNFVAMRSNQDPQDPA